MKRAYSITCLIVLLFIIQKTDAVIFFNDGLTHDINYKIEDAVSISMGTTVNLLSGGIVTGDVDIKDDSKVIIDGGEIGEWLMAWDSSHLTMIDGSITDWLGAVNNSQVIITGGSMRWLDALGNSRVIVYGGKVISQISAGNKDDGNPDESIITFVGTDFAINGELVGYGRYYASDYASGTLTGILFSGESINNYFVICDNASIVLIPEPSTLFLLVLGSLFLRRKSILNRT